MVSRYEWLKQIPNDWFVALAGAQLVGRLDYAIDRGMKQGIIAKALSAQTAEIAALKAEIGELKGKLYLNFQEEEKVVEVKKKKFLVHLVETLPGGFEAEFSEEFDSRDECETYISDYDFINEDSELEWYIYEEQKRVVH